MRRLLWILAMAALPLGCVPGTGAIRPEPAAQLGGDRSFAHASDGQIVHGPSLVSERVWGQRDRAGNIHVDAITPAPRR